LLDCYAKERSNWKVYTSLGQLRYLSASSIVDVVVGNSSSGILEVPSLKTPTVNIGDRQKGRIQAESVINCKPNSTEIINAIKKSFTLDCSNIYNPYGDGKTAPRVVDCLKNFYSPKALIKKHFFDVKFEL
jgi:UDP-N-acetylglucosamine 2-epimerase (non-hydrolysing)/GDP/UDP-N,N'-diacetylbacillosamine 2-epimerase (hydrolysing)